MSSLRDWLKTTSDDSTLAKQLDKTVSAGEYGKKEQDPHILKMPRSNNNNEGEILIRPLPNIPPGDPKNWTKEAFNSIGVYVCRYFWNFTLNGVRIIFNSPASIGNNDPIQEWRRSVYQEMGEEGANDWMRSRKISRNKVYYMNCLVLKCESNRELEGKVKIFQFGAQLKKILDAGSKGRPELSIPPKYYWKTDDGYDVLVSATYNPTAKQIHYNNSQLMPQSSKLAETDEEVDAILDQVMSLDDYILSPSQFDDYDTIKKRLNLALESGGSKSANNGTMKGSSSPDSQAKFDEVPSDKVKAQLESDDGADNEFNDLFDE